MKILISIGYGAGWATWNYGPRGLMKWMLTYQPIIEAVEAGEKLHEKHPIVQKFVEETKKKFNKLGVCVAGVENLVVEQIDDPREVSLTCFDGYERLNFKKINHEVDEEDAWDYISS